VEQSLRRRFGAEFLCTRKWDSVLPMSSFSPVGSAKTAFQSKNAGLDGMATALRVGSTTDVKIAKRPPTVIMA